MSPPIAVRAIMRRHAIRELATRRRVWLPDPLAVTGDISRHALAASGALAGIAAYQAPRSSEEQPRSGEIAHPSYTSRPSPPSLRRPG